MLNLIFIKLIIMGHLIYIQYIINYYLKLVFNTLSIITFTIIKIKIN